MNSLINIFIIILTRKRNVKKKLSAPKSFVLTSSTTVLKTLGTTIKMFISIFKDVFNL